jgi:hypothetical protein
MDENGPCIEYLQRAVAQLLMKNEKMRFELYAVRRKIASIDRTVFGTGSNDLQKVLPSTLLGALRDLCFEEAAGEPPGVATRGDTDAGPAFSSNNRPITRLHQSTSSTDRGK